MPSDMEMQPIKKRPIRKASVRACSTCHWWDHQHGSVFTAKCTNRESSKYKHTTVYEITCPHWKLKRKRKGNDSPSKMEII